LSLRVPLTCGALAALLLAGTARASPAARLVYARSPEAATCPDETALRAAVAARFGYDPFFPWARQTVVVQVARPHGKLVARVQLVDERGMAQGTREIASARRDCAELFDATALAISIALDILAQSEKAAERAAPEAAPEPPAGAATGTATGTATATATATTTATATATATTTPTPTPTTTATPTTTPTAPPPSLHPALGLDLEASVGLAPALVPGVSAFARLGLASISLAAEVRADAPASAADPAGRGGQVASHLFAGALVPCWHLGPLAGCAVGLFGVLEATGQDLPAPRSGSTWMAAAGGRVVLEWPLSARLALRARAEALGNLRRTTLGLGPDDVWTAPPVAGAAGAGLAWRFQ
jgi:hypothetical protein